MSDDIENLLKDDNGLYKFFPFMHSFPYPEYDFELEKGEINSISNNINPIIIEAAGKIVEPDLITFTTAGHIANLSISFYSFDIKYVRDVSKKIRKMDRISGILSDGIKSTDFKVKLNAIKEGSKFLKKIGSSLDVASSFNKILDGFIETQELSLTDKQEKLIKGLSGRINQDDFNEDLQDVILEYYNLHIHHVRILLGIVIAVKIH